MSQAAAVVPRMADRRSMLYGPWLDLEAIPKLNTPARSSQKTNTNGPFHMRTPQDGENSLTRLREQLAPQVVPQRPRSFPCHLRRPLGVRQ